MYTLKNKRNSGITLIALVITIIVLLILAGVSITMITGNNSILDQATSASRETTHANVYEQMQLEASVYTVDKSTGKQSNSLIDYLKSKSIISDILGEENKWLINVTTLLGSNQSIGKGTYPNDVYVLEKQATSTGSIVNTKVATTIPIRIASTNTKSVTYKITYYGNTASENITLGNLTDKNSDVATVIDYSDTLKSYLNDNNSYDEGGRKISNNGINPENDFGYYFGFDNIIIYKRKII